MLRVLEIKQEDLEFVLQAKWSQRGFKTKWQSSIGCFFLEDNFGSSTESQVAYGKTSSRRLVRRQNTAGATVMHRYGGLGTRGLRDQVCVAYAKEGMCLRSC